MKKVLIGLFLLTAQFIQAQEKLDSLNKIWLDPAIEDSIRLRAGLSMMNEQLETNFVEALELGEELVEFAQQKKMPKLEAEALHDQSRIYSRFEMESEALKLLEMSLELSLEVGDKEGCRYPNI